MYTENRARSASIVMRMCSLRITFLISNKKEYYHFFKSRSSDIVLLKLGNLHQNAKRYEARNTEREALWECASEVSRVFNSSFGQILLLWVNSNSKLWKLSSKWKIFLILQL